MAQNAAEETSRIQKIILEKQNGKKLVGMLHHAPGSSPDIVILCHGFRSPTGKESETILDIAKALEKAKINAFRLDFSGNGESEGKWSFSNYWVEVEDLRAAILHFNKNGGRVSAILGHSKGANVVLLYASKYHDVPAVISLSARFHLNAGLTERFGGNFMQILKTTGFIDVKTGDGTFDYRVTHQCLLNRLNINMEELCAQIDKNCKVLIVHGSKDNIAPVADASLFGQIIPNHQKEFIKKANHCYAGHRRILMAAILTFLKTV